MVKITGDKPPSRGPEGEGLHQEGGKAPSTGGRLRIIVVEDDQGTREAVAKWIAGTADFELIGEFADPRTALCKVAKLAPDVALVDINMPGLSGIEFVAKALLASPGTQFMMLTVYGDTDHIFQALAAGASGYLLKSTLRDQLVAAIREIHKGGSPMTSDVARKVVQSFHRASPHTSPEYALSGREKTVLDRLAVGYLYKEIAAEMGVSLATVSTYVRRIYVKLQVRSRAQAVAKTMMNK
jgi:DNA-binding NarL/FixJ family response regulator